MYLTILWDWRLKDKKPPSHKYYSEYYYIPDPFILQHEQVDKGAIRFILSGANIMCPGLTSPGAKMTPAEKDTIVVSFLDFFLRLP